jgi:hypothetical protein
MEARKTFGNLECSKFVCALSAEQGEARITSRHVFPSSEDLWVHVDVVCSGSVECLACNTTLRVLLTTT